MGARREGGGDVAHLVEHGIGTLTAQVRFPGAAGCFVSQSQLSVQTLLRCPYSPCAYRMHLHLCAR